MKKRGHLTRGRVRDVQLNVLYGKGKAMSFAPRRLTASSKISHKWCPITPETAEIIVGLHIIFDDFEKISSWLTVKNPSFGVITPLKLIQIGQGLKVLEFVNQAIEENALI